MKFYEVRPPGVWGDYGNILFGGMTQRVGRRNGQLQLERTGPFIPPMSLGSGSDLLVTEKMRTRLAASDLAKLQFRAVTKKKIVQLHWEKWDRSHDIPPEYDFEIEEPEDFILKFPHSEEASRQMGEVYEVVPPKCGEWRDLGYDEEANDYKSEVDVDAWDGSHIFLAKSPGDYVLIVSNVGKRWIEKEAPGWLNFGLAESGSS